ncbi:MAG: hypothetical protein MJ082_00075 [Clostridia bacterium]|nr:hypothetical protein [Clostridia bacterium]
MRKYIDDSFRRFLHGADYNPEQWLPDKTVWDEDMRLFSAPLRRERPRKSGR